MFSLITFNAAMLDVRILKKSVYCPVKLVSLRLPHLANGLLELGADIICLQEIFHPDLQHILYNKLKKEYPYVTGFTRRGFKLRLGNELLTFSRFPVSTGSEWSRLWFLPSVFLCAIEPVHCPCSTL